MVVTSTIYNGYNEYTRHRPQPRGVTDEAGAGYPANGYDVRLRILWQSSSAPGIRQ